MQMVYYDNFWVLLGSASVTLAVAAFIVLELFYKRARNSLAEMKRYGLKFGTSVSFAEIINVLAFFLIPILLSLLLTANGNISIFWLVLAYFILLFCYISVNFGKLLVCFVQYRRYMKFRSREFLSYVAPLALLLFLILSFPLHILGNVALAIISLVSLALGLISVVPTFDSFAAFDAVVIPTELARQLADQHLHKIRKQLKTSASRLNNIQAIAERAGKMDPLQKLSGDYDKFRHQLVEALDKEKVAYSAIHKYYDELDIIKFQIEKLG